MDYYSFTDYTEGWKAEFRGWWSWLTHIAYTVCRQSQPWIRHRSGKIRRPKTDV